MALHQTFLFTPSNPIQATGGIISLPGDGYKYHTFNSSGQFIVSNTGTDGIVEYLVVAGGGGGGSRLGSGGGGGGAGGMLTGNTTVNAITYTVTIGGGGAGGVNTAATPGSNGTNSFFVVTAVGGGGGGASDTSATGQSGRNGGSGGGRGGNANTSGVIGVGTTGQGSNGGNAAGTGGGAGGGGGGKGAVGSNGTSTTAGAGGNGQIWPVGGTIFYAGGGGGGGSSTTRAAGGSGGGGAGGIRNSNDVALRNGIAGTTNLGGGGGGGAANTTNGTGAGAAGGSGIVIIRYLSQESFSFTSDGSSLSGWTSVNATVNSTTGNPASSFQATGGQYAYIDVGISLLGRTIELDMYNLATNSTTLSNFYFACNSSGAGQMFRLESRSGFLGTFASTTSWTNWASPSTGARFNTLTWHRVRITISSGGVADVYVNGSLVTSGYTIANNGSFIGIHGDGGTVAGGLFDNIIVY